MKQSGIHGSRSVADLFERPQKMRVNRGQEFVIGGYTRAARAFDALIFGYYEDGQLVYVARTRNGFTPASRERVIPAF